MGQDSEAKCSGSGLQLQNRCLDHLGMKKMVVRVLN